MLILLLDLNLCSCHVTQSLVFSIYKSPDCPPPRPAEPPSPAPSPDSAGLAAQSEPEMKFVAATNCPCVHLPQQSLSGWSLLVPWPEESYESAVEHWHWQSETTTVASTCCCLSGCWLITAVVVVVAVAPSAFFFTNFTQTIRMTDTDSFRLLIGQKLHMPPSHWPTHTGYYLTSCGVYTAQTACGNLVCV